MESFTYGKAEVEKEPMQIGVMNHPARDPVDEIEWIAKNGFEFVDFTLEPPAAAPDQVDVDAVRAALQRHQLGVVAQWCQGRTAANK